MKRIINLNKAKKLSDDIQRSGKTVALTGGCFDILHIGHLSLFQKAKKSADTVFVFLESDEKIQHLKGHDKPIHQQHDRAALLSELRSIDYIIPLPFFETNDKYDAAVNAIHPNFLVTTKGDTSIIHKKRQAEAIGAQIVYAPFTPNISTTKIADILRKEL